MSKTSEKTILSILKKIVVQEITEIIKNKKMAEKVTEKVFKLSKEKQLILDAFFEDCSNTPKSDYYRSFKTCMDIALELREFSTFSDAEIINYMFSNGYELTKEYNGDLKWMIYKKKYNI